MKKSDQTIYPFPFALSVLFFQKTVAQVLSEKRRTKLSNLVVTFLRISTCTSTKWILLISVNVIGSKGLDLVNKFHSLQPNLFENFKEEESRNISNSRITMTYDSIIML